MKFRLIEKKGDSSPVSLAELKQYYDEYNKKYFNNELPAVPIKFTISKIEGGNATAIIRNNKVHPLSLGISLFFKKDKETLLKILLHEMIHFVEFNWINKQVEKYPSMSANEHHRTLTRNAIQGHSLIFHSILRDLNTKYNLGIPMTDEVENLGISADVKIRETYFIMGKKKGEDMYAVLMPPKDMNWGEYFSKLSSRASDYRFTIYKTKDSRLLTKTRQKWGKRALQFFVPPSYLDEIIKTAEVVFK